MILGFWEIDNIGDGFEGCFTLLIGSPSKEKVILPQ
jgi:hypothetical protein